MSEETNEVQGQVVESGGESQEDVDYKKVVAEQQELIEQLKKINAGNDKKVTELFKEIDTMKKVVSEKDDSKKTVEQQLQEMQNQLAQRDAREKAREKEALVHKIIAKNKLDPEFDFDFLHKFETPEAIEENALKRVEYYKKIKEDGFKEKAHGTVPRGGVSAGVDLTQMSLEDLNKMAIEKPEMKAQIVEAIGQKYRS